MHTTILICQNRKYIRRFNDVSTCPDIIASPWWWEKTFYQKQMPNIASSTKNYGDGSPSQSKVWDSILQGITIMSQMIIKVKEERKKKICIFTHCISWALKKLRIITKPEICTFTTLKKHPRWFIDKEGGNIYVGNILVTLLVKLNSPKNLCIFNNVWSIIWKNGEHTWRPPHFNISFHWSH